MYPSNKRFCTSEFRLFPGDIILWLEENLKVLIAYSIIDIIY